MNRKIWNLLMFAAAVGMCYLFWMLFLGSCCIDGFLDLDVVEAGNTSVKYDFIMLCLCPPITMGYVVQDLIIVEIKRRRVKNGDKIED